MTNTPIETLRRDRYPRSSEQLVKLSLAQRVYPHDPRWPSTTASWPRPGRAAA
jgi:hypothetical protein